MAAMRCFAQLLAPNSVENVLVEKGVYRVVGCHAKMPQQFNGGVQERTVDLHQYP